MISTAAKCLGTLVHDEHDTTAATAIQVLTVLMRTALHAYAKQPSSPELQAAWSDVQQAITGAAKVALGTGGCTARLPGIKLLEVAVLMYTADAAPAAPSANGRQQGAAAGEGKLPLPDASKLAGEGTALLQELLGKLKAAEAAAQPGPALVALIRAVAAVALCRPNLLGKSLMALMALASQVS